MRKPTETSKERLKKLCKTKQLFLKHYYESNGNMTKSCFLANVSRATIFRYRLADETFNTLIEEINEGVLDMVEGKLIELALSGNDKCIQFYLKSKGKKRGYGDKVDITTDGKSINKIEIIEYDPKTKND